MVDFLHYGIRKPAVYQAPAPKAKVESKKVEKKVEEKKEEEVVAQVVMAETTAPVMEEEKIVIAEGDTVQDVVEKMKKSKKLHAKVSEGGKRVRVKRVLKETTDEE